MRKKFLDFTPFSKLSRHKQRDEFIKLRQKIKNKKHGENFYGWSPLAEPGRPALYNQEVQIYFLGLDGRTIWNAYVFTAAYAYWGNISEIASNKAWELAPEKNRRLLDDLIPQYDSSGRLKHYIMKEELPHPALGNKTRGEFMQEYESELIRHDTGEIAPVFEEFRIEPGFEYGIGLYATIDVPTITVDALESMKYSFTACLRNIMPMTLYSIIALLLLIVGLLPAGLGLLVVIPWLMITMYTSYQDIFIAND
jgi:hypothetical protein